MLESYQVFMLLYGMATIGFIYDRTTGPRRSLSNDTQMAFTIGLVTGVVIQASAIVAVKTCLT